MNTAINIIVIAAVIINVIVARRLNRKIDALDEAMFQYMKEEHNARVESDEM